jgi:hypothetical protein
MSVLSIEEVRKSVLNGGSILVPEGIDLDLFRKALVHSYKIEQVPPLFSLGEKDEVPLPRLYAHVPVVDRALTPYYRIRILFQEVR